MKIYIGADHAGYELKEKLKIYLSELGYKTEDKGASQYNADDDFPDFVTLVAESVAEDKGSFGIILGGSGQGEAIVANRFKNVRAAVYYGSPRAESRGKDDLDIIKLSREHNDANVLALAAGFLDDNTAREMLRLWLETPFTNEERHIRRIKKIDS